MFVPLNKFGGRKSQHKNYCNLNPINQISIHKTGIKFTGQKIKRKKPPHAEAFKYKKSTDYFFFDFGATFLAALGAAFLATATTVPTLFTTLANLDFWLEALFL